MIDKKKCSVCGEEKLLENFYKQKLGYLGRRANCKICSNKKINKWKLEHPDYNKKYYNNNSKKRNESSKKYYLNNREACLEYSKKYYSKNKEKLLKYGKSYYIEHSEKSKNYGRNYYANNKDMYRIHARNRYKKNLELSAIKWMRNFLYRTEQHGFNKTKLNTLSEFGYTPKQLIERIECQFKDGMSWNNRKEWHIDHKKPISKFKYGTSPKLINMLSNLQPLWAKENVSKGNR